MLIRYYFSKNFPPFVFSSTYYFTGNGKTYQKHFDIPPSPKRKIPTNYETNANQNSTKPRTHVIQRTPHRPLLEKNLLKEKNPQKHDEDENRRKKQRHRINKVINTKYLYKPQVDICEFNSRI